MPQWFLWRLLAQAQLNQITQKQAKRILDAIANLRDGKGDIQPIKGYEPLLRLRIGVYRVIFLELPEGRFGIVGVGHRREVYRVLESLPGNVASLF